MNTLHFNAPWGRALRVISIAVTVLMLAISGFVLWRAGNLQSLLGLSGILPLLILLGAAPFVVRGYQIQGSELFIERLFWKTRVPLEGLISATSESRAMHGSIRTFGNGGMYSITGWYWSRSLRSYRAFVTDLNRTVILRFPERTIVVSPDEPDKFVAAVSDISGSKRAGPSPERTPAVAS